MDHVHIYPCEDLITHEVGAVEDGYSCRCNPGLQYDWEEDTCLVVHYAMDGRETSEESPAFMKSEHEKDFKLTVVRIERQ